MKNKRVVFIQNPNYEILALPRIEFFHSILLVGYQLQILNQSLLLFRSLLSFFRFTWLARKGPKENTEFFFFPSICKLIFQRGFEYTLIMGFGDRRWIDSDAHKQKYKTMLM